MRDVLFRFVRYLYHASGIDKVNGWLSDRRATWMVPVVERNYRGRLIALRKSVRRGGRIKVGFLVNDASKWKYQSVYDRMLASTTYQPVVFVTLTRWYDGLERAEREARDVYSYFERRGINVLFAYSFESHKPISLRKFGPDIVFFEQPWDIFPLHDPSKVSEFALTCYSFYSIPNLEVLPVHCKMPFHRLVFRHFTLSQEWARLAYQVRGRVSAVGKIVATGHPGLDEFHDCNLNANRTDGIVIYAPHWAFPHKDNPNFLDVSTFLWTGRAMLDYARKHPEIKWAFKPHPVLRIVLSKSGVMTEDEVDAYYGEWEEIGESCYTGDYPDLFRRSRAMITDCVSFLSEYGCTGKPLVRLVAAETKVKFCHLTDGLYSTYYQVRKIEELEPALDDLLVKGNDPNREARQAAAKAMNLTGTDAAGNIMRHLEELIFGKGAGEKEA